MYRGSLTFESPLFYILQCVVVDLGSSTGLGSVSLNPDNVVAGRIRAAVESVLVYHLMEVFLTKMPTANILSCFYDIEMPVCKLLAKMEQNGFGMMSSYQESCGMEWLTSPISKAQCAIFSGYNLSESDSQQSAITQRLIDLETKAHHLAGRPFNLTSSQDLGQVHVIRISD